METIKIRISPIQVKRVAFVYLIVSGVAFLYGQNLDSYQKTQEQKIDSTLESLKEKNGLQFLSLAPSVNYNDFTGLNVGVNLSSVVNYAQSKRRNRIEAAKLRVQLENRLKRLVNTANEKEILILDEYEILSLELDILAYKYELFRIDSLKHENQEITYSSFVTSKIKYQNYWKSVFANTKKLNMRIQKFYNEYGYKPIINNVLIETIKNYEINQNHRTP